ncbi:hypothetical protein AVEN_48967-1 [Araneus ventricosus]|uniref:Uncharacterized protein n=1 Tax=Araneus ventricosus TaxID=182803 RepID=A0A4Y2AH01_ARAVE|nr:hypothetical protein AVEN_48967-1 [Araneus ventricosus]
MSVALWQTFGFEMNRPRLRYAISWKIHIVYVPWAISHRVSKVLMMKRDYKRSAFFQVCKLLHHHIVVKVSKVGFWLSLLCQLRYQWPCGRTTALKSVNHSFCTRFHRRSTCSMDHFISSVKSPNVAT